MVAASARRPSIGRESHVDPAWRRCFTPCLGGPTICYLNSDLDLTSAEDLTALAASFDAGGIPPLHVTHDEDGLWYATFETDIQFTEPGPNIAAMLSLVESLPGPLRKAWEGCTRREFNIGYECGAEPWAFNQGVAAELLGRMATAGASLRITLYPEREPGASDKSLR